MFSTGYVKLRPSEVLFSQDTISNYFNDKCRHSTKMIGETLDDICEGRCSITDIPRISVMKKGTSWITADNRRLWLFQCLENLGRCDYITAKIVYSILPDKLNSTNGGKRVRVRRGAGGQWYGRVSWESGTGSCSHPRRQPSFSRGDTSRNQPRTYISDREHTINRSPFSSNNRESTDGPNVRPSLRGSPDRFSETSRDSNTRQEEAGPSILIGVLAAGAALLMRWLFSK